MSKITKFSLLFLVITSISMVTVSAKELVEDKTSLVISAFRSYKDIDAIVMKAPVSVIETPITETINRFDFIVLNKNTNIFEPYYFKQETSSNEVPVLVTSSENNTSADSMNDKDSRTYTEFLLPENAQGNVTVTLSSVRPITSSSLGIVLDNNIASPNSIEIRAMVGDQNKIIVARKSMGGEYIYFPKTTSNKWLITFTFGQLLRISELHLNQDDLIKTNVRAVRFLGQSNNSYRIYFNPDRSVVVPVREAGDLISVKDFLKIPASVSQNNPTYSIADTDSDSVADIRDNCVSVPNGNQEDIDNNGRGDVCDDFDQDGISNQRDNCPNNPNRYQEDADGDRIGDICDQEESRVTERYKWIPWLGIGVAALVLIVLLFLMVKSKKRVV